MIKKGVIPFPVIFKIRIAMAIIYNNNIIIREKVVSIYLINNSKKNNKIFSINKTKIIINTYNYNNNKLMKI